MTYHIPLLIAAIVLGWAAYELIYGREVRRRKFKPLVYAVDFDGYLCKEAWPDIGKPNMRIIRHYKRLKAKGHKLILWTCREGEMLQKAIDWCAQFGLYFDAHNANLPERIALYGNDPRKIGANRYGDDRSENIKLKFWRR